MWQMAAEARFQFAFRQSICFANKGANNENEY